MQIKNIPVALWVVMLPAEDERDARGGKLQFSYLAVSTRIECRNSAHPLLRSGGLGKSGRGA